MTPAPAASWKPLLVCALALLWRAASVPPALLWRDWVVVVALLAALQALRPEERRRELAGAAAAAYLLGLYGFGQLPHALRVLGWG